MVVFLENSGYAHGYAGKAGATGKSLTPNAGNAVRYGYTGKLAAIVKSLIHNVGNARGYGKRACFSCRVHD